MSEFNGILTLTVFLPALAGLVILLAKPLQLEDRIIRWFAILTTVATFVLSLIVFLSYDRVIGGVQFIDHLSWLSAETIKSSYLLGVDGLSAPLVLLTGLLGLAAAFASRNIGLRVSEYFIWLLLLETAVMGVFVSLDLLLFFVFFEFEVIPMFMLISLWGSGRPRYSAMKFVLYTLTGGAFMFVGIFAVYLTGAVDTLTMVAVPQLGIVGIADQIAGVDLIAPASLIFAFFLVAFAVKLPVWPLHNWLPDAHTDAPTAVSVMLAGVLLKMAGYGMIRINIGFFQETNGFHGARCRGHPCSRCRSKRRIRRGGDDTSDRHEAIDSLLIGEPHGLRTAWVNRDWWQQCCDSGGRCQRCGVADVYAWHHHGIGVPYGRTHIRPDAHAAYPASRWTVATNASDRYLLLHRGIRFARIAGVVWLRLRDYGFPQFVPGVAVGGEFCRVRSCARGGLCVVDDSAHLLRLATARGWDTRRQI